MADDPRFKRLGTHGGPRRLQSATERDLASAAARAEREAQDAVPSVEVDDEISGHYDVEERAQMRAKRPTDKRIALLEVKHDTLDASVQAIEVRTANMDGKLDVLLKMMPAALQVQTMTVTTKLEVEKAGELDKIDARKSKREITKAWIGGAVAVAVTIAGVIAFLVEKGC